MSTLAHKVDPVSAILQLLHTYETLLHPPPPLWGTCTLVHPFDWYMWGLINNSFYCVNKLAPVSGIGRLDYARIKAGGKYGRNDRKFMSQFWINLAEPITATPPTASSC